MKENLLDKGVAKEKIELVYNWVDENAVIPVKRSDNPLFSRFALKADDFYLTYCGNLGHTQNLELLVQVARELQEYKQIHFLLIGEGAYEAELRKILEKSQVVNMTILPFQPYEDRSCRIY